MKYRHKTMSLHVISVWFLAVILLLTQTAHADILSISSSSEESFIPVTSPFERDKPSTSPHESPMSSDLNDFPSLSPLSAAGTANREIAVISVTDYGADSSDQLDDSAAFIQAANEAARIVKELGIPVRIFVPSGSGSFILGSGVGVPDTLGKSIPVTSNVFWSGYGDDGTRAKIIFNGARTAQGQSRVFVFNDAAPVENAMIAGFDIDGAGQVAVGISMEGIVKNIMIDDVQLVNFHNFAVQYADEETDPSKAYFENVTLSRVSIGGSSNPISGKGSGINFFARTTVMENGLFVPRSSRLDLNDVHVDVSNGSSKVSDHGPQAIKVNGVRGGTWQDVHTTGGQIAGINITNGARDLVLTSIYAEKAAAGIYLTTTGNTTVSTLTQDISIDGFEFKNAGVTNHAGIALSARGVDINGSVHNVVMNNIDIEGHFEISESPQVQVKILPSGPQLNWQRGDIVSFSAGSAEVVAMENGFLRLARVTGTLTAGTILSGPGGTMTAEEVDYLNSPKGLRLTNVKIHDGRFYVRNTANSSGNAIKDIQVQTLTFTGSHPAYGQIILGGKRRWVENSRFTGISSYRDQQDVVIDTYGRNNVFEFAAFFALESYCNLLNLREPALCSQWAPSFEGRINS